MLIVISRFARGVQVVWQDDTSEIKAQDDDFKYMTDESADLRAGKTILRPKLRSKLARALSCFYNSLTTRPSYSLFKLKPELVLFSFFFNLLRKRRRNCPMSRENSRGSEISNPFLRIRGKRISLGTCARLVIKPSKFPEINCPKTTFQKSFLLLALARRGRKKSEGAVSRKQRWLARRRSRRSGERNRRALEIKGRS